MIYAIETDNRAVAITNDEDVVARLNGCDPVLRETARHMKRGDLPLWGGESEFSSRPATPDECAAYHDWLERGGLVETGLLLDACASLPRSPTQTDISKQPHAIGFEAWHAGLLARLDGAQ